MFQRFDLRKKLLWGLLSCAWLVAIMLASTHQQPITFAGGSKEKTLQAAKQPAEEIGERVYIWENEDKPGNFSPAGWMPKGEGITQNTSETDTPHSKPHCIRIRCQLSAHPWVGIYFLLEGEWEPAQPFNLFQQLSAKQGDTIKCRFWARSKDLTWIQCKVGGVTKGKVQDSLTFPVSSPWVKLGPEWKMYEIDLTKDNTGKNRDLSSLVGAFMWVCDRAHNGAKDVSFDLDDIYFVKVKQ
jgi:hypothetical protein